MEKRAATGRQETASLVKRMSGPDVVGPGRNPDNLYGPDSRYVTVKSMLEKMGEEGTWAKRIAQRKSGYQRYLCYWKIKTAQRTNRCPKLRKLW